MTFGSHFGSSFGSGLSNPFPSAPSSSGISLRELMMLQLAREATKHTDKGFLSSVEHGTGKILGDIGHPIGQLFHQIERPYFGSIEALNAEDNFTKQHGSGWAHLGGDLAAGGKAFAHGFLHGTKLTGADIAQKDFPGLKNHHILKGIAGFGYDVAYDPLSAVGFGVKGTKEVVAGRRLLLSPKNWWDINASSSGIKKAIASGANPDHYKYRKALNLFDRKLYKASKQVANFKGEPFQSKNGAWLDHLFKESTHKPELVDLLTQRGDLASMAFHESMLHDPRFKTLQIAGKDIFHFGKNVATKEHNSSLAKLFSNVSRYGKYYPLSIIGVHSGARLDIVRRMLAEGAKPQDIRDYIKQTELRRVKTVLAHGEGIPLKTTDKTLHAALKKEARSIKGLYEKKGVPFSQMMIEDPKVLTHLGLNEPNDVKMASKVRSLYHATPTQLLKMAEMNNPAAEKLSKLGGGEFRDVAVSKEAKSFLAEYRKQFLTDENLHKYIKGIEHGRSIIKRGYTGANPFGYAIRNSLTDVWNAALTHVPIFRGMARNVPKAFSMIKQYDHVTEKLVKGEKLTAAERGTYSQVHRMHDLGILSGLFAKDVQEDRVFLNQINPERGRDILKRTKGRRILHAYATGAVHTNETRENTGRMAHYLYRLSKGESPEEAAQMVKAAHFDYQDITPFEQKTLKSIFPFYTWYRKNIPFQLRMIPEKPGQFLRYFHAASESQQASGDKKQGLMPGYLAQAPAAFRLPFGKNMYANPAVGLQDLQSVEHPISDLEQKVGPPANLLLAYLTGKDNFSGTDLSNNRLTPTNPLLGKLFSKIPEFNKIPGLEVGATQRQGANGQKIKSYGVSPWTNFLLGQIPGASLVQGANPVSVAHRGLPSFHVPGVGPFPTGPALSYFGGQSVTAPDSNALAGIQQQNIKKEVTAMLQKLYDSGVLKPKVHRQTRFDRMFAKAASG